MKDILHKCVTDTGDITLTEKAFLGGNGSSKKVNDRYDGICR